ncbi:hypothetical protein [Seohaeicola zhoushanensis]|uniref:DUF2157 domain-containing protein n=1 Tax=Seohaeicola zhoushanensis TaxID=1569283 RepID=A0A8J3M3U2_9RHOB|nr:hypothetical protein [Seohaeicola zhoushanensis]GHF35298.1 hypothetical protein GCM10017056_03520 [Seohaeicola zhoushanensis]
MAEPPAEIGTDDIRAAVASGLLSERQAAALTALAHSRRGAREDLAAGDEPFELFRGFNEIFIMVGLSILAAGWIGIAAWWVYDDLTVWKSSLVTICSITAALIWLLSEYFIRIRRMVGPAILLTIFFAANAVFGLAQWHAQVFMLAQEDYSSLILPGFLAVAATGVFWLRFKVPFAMALIALGLFATALLIAATSAGKPQSVTELFVLSGQGGFAWVTLALGLATFVVAMLFDGSDPHRVTRRAAQGFWLHLVAAPMIINTVALSLLDRGTVAAQWQILAMMVLFAVVAVVIDRRSFLLAAISYVVSVIVALNPLTEDIAFAALILALGLFLVLLGAFWARIRGALVAVLPLGGLRRRLPPIH